MPGFAIESIVRRQALPSTVASRLRPGAARPDHHSLGGRRRAPPRAS